MRSQRGRFRAAALVALFGALLLDACAGPQIEKGPPTRPIARPAPPLARRAPEPPAPSPPLPAPPPPSAPVVASLESLPGWSDEDFIAALQAVRLACASARSADPAGVCLRAAWLDTPTPAQAREFLERNFRAAPAGDVGLLTGYFTPIYDARLTPDAEFSAPVRPHPHGATGPLRADRAEIDTWPTGDALAWMRPEDLFFLQIQGSGVLVFDDGSRLRATYDGANAAPFTGIGGAMRARALLGADTSGMTIHDWLARNRGPTAQAVMDVDRHYVFFRLGADDGAPPAGAAGVRLMPGRSLAVDPSAHRMGELLWVAAEAPTLPGAFPAYHRLAVALDTGSAIRGPVRADLYLGVGDAAGTEAGRIRHNLRLFRLEPIAPQQAAGDSPIAGAPPGR